MNLRLHSLRVLRASVLIGAIVLGGCATRPSMPGTTPGTVVAPGSSQVRYEVVAGRNADLVARMRAAPAPAQPEVSDGNTRTGDENFLREQGLIEIGIGYFPAGDLTGARQLALQRGIEVGADTVEIYAPVVDPQATSPAELVATYFVRLQLPFGADFRDLTSAERESLGQSGVEIGNVIGRTPASAANLRSGDYILKFNGTHIKDKAAFQALLQSHMGRNVTLTIRRGKVTLKRMIRLGTLPAAAAQ